MSRVCRTCQHLKRAEIDRRLAAGEPAAQLAHDYALNPSSLYRHRANCLKLGSSNAIMKDAARGTAAVDAGFRLSRFEGFSVARSGVMD
jgi:hypothetical protein